MEADSPCSHSLVKYLDVRFLAWSGPKIAASTVSGRVRCGRMFKGLEIGRWTHSRRLGLLRRSLSLLLKLALVVVGWLVWLGQAAAPSISRKIFLEASFMARGLGSGPVRFDCAARCGQTSTGPGCGEEVQRATCSWSISETRALGSGPERFVCAACRGQATGASFLSRL